MSTQCNGYTLKGDRCKKKILTSSLGQYCCTHTDQKNNKFVPTHKQISCVNNVKFDISLNLIGYQPIGECSICCDNVYEINNSDLECGHIFHIECIKTLRNPTCPCCRANLKSTKITTKDLLNMKERQIKDTQENNNILIEDYLRDNEELSVPLPIYQTTESNSYIDDEILNSILSLSIVEYIEYATEATGLSPEQIYSLFILDMNS